jgi:hypothetical protein
LSSRNISGVKCGTRVWLTNSPSVSRFSRKYGILDVSQPYRPPRPLTGMALLYFYLLPLFWASKAKPSKQMPRGLRHSTTLQGAASMRIGMFEISRCFCTSTSCNLIRMRIFSH